MAIIFLFMPAKANEGDLKYVKLEEYISTLYRQIDFSKCDRLSYNVFNSAVHGYLNLRQAGRLDDEKQIITICNFDLPSTENRLWVIDLKSKKVLFNTYVAHGQGTGEDCATMFSNNFNSHQSSLGFYITSDVYTGEHGISLRLEGMDAGFNDAAMDRGIVVHGADYVCSKFIEVNERLGRSWGCPAVPAKLASPIINTIKGGTCLFAYFPDKDFLESSHWLNKVITQLPEDILRDGLLSSAETTNIDNKTVYIKPATKKILQQNNSISKIEYSHDGVIDSVKIFK